MTAAALLARPPTITAADIPLSLWVVARAARSARTAAAFQWGCERARQVLAEHRSRP